MANVVALALKPPDLSEFLNFLNNQQIALGHENAGWVEEVGKGVEGFKKGDPVICHPLISDCHALTARRGQDMHVEGSEFPGISTNGGYAELLRTVGYGGETRISALDMITSEKRIIGNLVGNYSELVELMELAQRGKVHLTTQYYKLSEANQALHELKLGHRVAFLL